MLIDGIGSFLDHQIQLYPRLEEWLGDWEPGHETQIQVDPTGLHPVVTEVVDGRTVEAIDHSAKQPRYWIDDHNFQHRNIRIPYGSNTESPKFSDRKVLGNIYQHWKYLGTSGWHWKKQKSMSVGYDFDSVANHSGGLEPDQLQEVLNRALELPYVTARTSKSGKGFHLIVRLDPWISTRTHGEHAALAQDVLRRMSEDCDFQFHDAADCAGLILWHWEKNLNDNGLQRINNFEHDGLDGTNPAGTNSGDNR